MAEGTSSPASSASVSATTPAGKGTQSSVGENQPTEHPRAEGRASAGDEVNALAGKLADSVHISQPENALSASHDTTADESNRPVAEAAASANADDQVATLTEEEMQAGIEVFKGKVKWFNVIRGYGFISREDDLPDVFVYQLAIKRDGYRSLAEGEDVEMKVKLTEKGPEAILVTGPNGIQVQGSMRSRTRRKNNKCYNCGVLGHIAKDCNQPASPKKCHICYAEDHIKANCPLLRQASGRFGHSHLAAFAHMNPYMMAQVQAQAQAHAHEQTAQHSAQQFYSHPQHAAAYMQHYHPQTVAVGGQPITANYVGHVHGNERSQRHAASVNPNVGEPSILGRPVGLVPHELYAAAGGGSRGMIAGTNASTGRAASSGHSSGYSSRPQHGSIQITGHRQPHDTMAAQNHPYSAQQIQQQQQQQLIHGQQSSQQHYMTMSPNQAAQILTTGSTVSVNGDPSLQAAIMTMSGQAGSDLVQAHGSMGVSSPYY